jgi:hypothetical protein
VSRDRTVPLLLLAGTAGVVLCVLQGVGQPLRSVVVALFMLLAPGAAVLLWTRGWPVLVLTTAVLSVSVAVDVLLSTALFYLGWWSPLAILALLAALCTGCAGVRLWTRDAVTSA